MHLPDIHRSRSYYCAVQFARCPDLHTIILFLASLEHTKFLELFLRQGHGKLASLQVLFYTGSRRAEQYCQFWSALRPAQSLQKLQLVISATQAEPVKEVDYPFHRANSSLFQLLPASMPSAKASR